MKINDVSPIPEDAIDDDSSTVIVNEPAVAADIAAEEKKRRRRLETMQQRRDDGENRPDGDDHPPGDESSAEHVGALLDRSPPDGSHLIIEIVHDGKGGQITVIEEHENRNVPISLRTVFIAGEMAGIGMLLTPWAVINLGWIGIACLFVVGIATAYSGSVFQKCLLKVWESDTFVQDGEEHHYKTIASHAMGKNMRCLTTACIQTTLFGSGTVYLLLLAQSAQHLFDGVTHPEVNLSTWIYVFAIALTTLTFIEVPRKLRCLAALGIITVTVLACSFVANQILEDGKIQKTVGKHFIWAWNENQLFLSLGAILFSFGCGPVFPTIILPNNKYFKYPFHLVVAIFFALTALLGLAIAGACVVYGKAVNPNILLSLDKDSWTAKTTIITMMLHLVLNFAVTIIPVFQHFERFFAIPNEFCIKKCVLRFTFMSGMLCLAQSVQNCSVLVAMIGSITIVLITFVFPPLFYLKLYSTKDGTWQSKGISFKEKLVLYSMIIGGLFAIAIALTVTFYNILGLKSIIEPFLLGLIPAEIF